MIRFETPKSYEECRVCGEKCNVKIVFEDHKGNCSTEKLCIDCENDLGKKLYERIMERMSRVFAGGAEDETL